jgi:ATP-binding cassette subfamily E protein 1
MVETADEMVQDKSRHYKYPDMTKTLGSFKLTVEAGSFTNSEIIVMLGENGMGKDHPYPTSCWEGRPGRRQQQDEFVRLTQAPEDCTEIPGDRPNAAAQADQDHVHAPAVPDRRRQTHVSRSDSRPRSEDIVWRRAATCGHRASPRCSGQALTSLSPCTGLINSLLQADVYLLDEPSSFLDSEQRIIASKVIKRFILHAKRTAFVIEHDFIMATYLADRVVVFKGTPAIAATATP